MDGMGNNPYEAEARERWGDTEAYKESSRRTQQYRPEDWARISCFLFVSLASGLLHNITTPPIRICT